MSIQLKHILVICWTIALMLVITQDSFAQIDVSHRVAISLPSETDAEAYLRMTEPTNLIKQWRDQIKSKAGSNLYFSRIFEKKAIKRQIEKEINNLEPQLNALVPDPAKGIHFNTGQLVEVSLYHSPVIGQQVSGGVKYIGSGLNPIDAMIRSNDNPTMSGHPAELENLLPDSESSYWIWYTFEYSGTAVNMHRHLIGKIVTPTVRDMYYVVSLARIAVSLAQMNDKARDDLAKRLEALQKEMDRLKVLSPSLPAAGTSPIERTPHDTSGIQAEKPMEKPTE